MMPALMKAVIVTALLAIMIPVLFLFTVDQRQYALVFQLGEIVKVIDKPGLYWKWPLIQNVRYLDRRIMTLESSEPELYITSEKKNVLVDSFVKWRILDPSRYYMAVNGEEARARTRLAQTINDKLRNQFSKRTVRDVISAERDAIMKAMMSGEEGSASADAKSIGVEIVDVRLKRVDYTAEISDSVFQRMKAERTRIANELRSQGAAQAEKRRAEADRERSIIEADAYRDAQKIKGDGDAQAASIYAQAYQAHPGFYDFYRSLEAYRNSFKNRNDLIIVEPEADFFKYLKNPDKVH